MYHEIVKSPSGSYYISGAHSFPRRHIKVGSRAAEISFCSSAFFFAQGQSVTHIHSSPLFPHVSFTFYFLHFLRPDVAVHQPGHPHLYRVFGDPQGAGSPLLQDPVAHSGCTQHLRALGKSLSVCSPLNHLTSHFCRSLCHSIELIFLHRSFWNFFLGWMKLVKRSRKEWRGAFRTGGGSNEEERGRVNQDWDGKAVKVNSINP